jgi:hypothetical protein
LSIMQNAFALCSGRDSRYLVPTSAKYCSFVSQTTQLFIGSIKASNRICACRFFLQLSGQPFFTRRREMSRARLRRSGRRRGRVTGSSPRTLIFRDRAGTQNGEGHTRDVISKRLGACNCFEGLRAGRRQVLGEPRNRARRLEGFADGWFARRHRSTQAALEAAKHIGDAATPSDVFREYQNWLAQAMELLVEDGKAYQQQVLRAAAHVSALPEARQAG